MTVPPVVAAIGKINITGNVIPSVWWRRVLTATGRPDSVGIMILSEIVYWYRPREIRDEASGHFIGFDKRFKGDKLQRSYQSFVDQFGFSKEQVKDAIDRLVKNGLVTREFRHMPGIANLVHLEPVPRAIRDLCDPKFQAAVSAQHTPDGCKNKGDHPPENPPYGGGEKQGDHPRENLPHEGVKKGGTYTGNTQRLHTENKNTPVAEQTRDVFAHWQQVMNSPRSKLDDKRSIVIAKALKTGYSVDQLKQAIDGCKLSPFHMGDNDRRTKYNGLDVILRSAEKIDSFIEMTTTPPAPQSKPAQRMRVTANTSTATPVAAPLQEDDDGLL